MNDRDLLEAKYTSPSGKEFTFFWEKLSRTTELKTGVFLFPDKDGAHVQHQGGGAISHPMTCIFNGEGHVQTANDFEMALLERDVAELQHPVYGVKKVIPTGSISRDNDLINDINESHVTITFTETITDDPVSLQAVTADKLTESFDNLMEVVAVDFAESLTVENINEQLLIQSSLNAQTNIIKDNLSGLTMNEPDFITTMGELQENIDTMFNDPEKMTINALNTARLTLNTIKTPSRVNVNIFEKARGYIALAAQIQKQFRNDPFGVNNIKNAFASTRLILSGVVASLAIGSALGIAENAINNNQGVNNSGNGNSGGGLSRDEAVEVAAQTKNLLSTIQNFEDKKITNNNDINTVISHIRNQLDIIKNDTNLYNSVSTSFRELHNTLRDYEDGKIDKNDFNNILIAKTNNMLNAIKSANITNNSVNSIINQFENILSNIQNIENRKGDYSNFVDSNATAYFMLNQLVDNSINLIFNVALSLPLKRIIKLGYDRNIIELCAEIYGSVDNYYIDKLIVENNLNIDDMEIIPMGREVLYYA